MPSHFSTIGLPVQGEEDFLGLANRIADDSEAVEVADGRYLRWTSDCGAEIWLQLDGANDLIGMLPHFAGESKLRVGISSRVSRPGDTPLDGAFLGWADPSDDVPETGTYPFVFDSPNYRQHSELAIPSIVSAQIAAFAREVSIFDSIEEFDASQTGDTKFASQSFIPSGLFTPDGKPTDPQQSCAIFTGHVVQAATKCNELTDRPYYWALVDSLGGSFDVVIDPELVENLPKVGGVLTGSFWLSGSLCRDGEE